MALVFDFYNSIIEVPAPQTSVDLQTLINEIRDTEDELTPGLANSQIAEAFGKQNLGGSVSVGITLVLLDNWKLRFEARPGPDTVACIVTGGNLVAESGNPIASSAFTSVTIAQSSSPTIATPESDTNLLYLVESLVGSRRGVGQYLYWNPINGDDANDGTKPTKAVATFSQAQTLVIAGNNDVIFCMSSNTSGTTTVTETLTVTKNNLKIRGPGYIFQLIPTLDTSPTINITADNVELSGIYISTAGTGSQNAISITGDNALIKDTWITGSRGSGISISSSTRSTITSSVIELNGKSGTGDGITFGNSTTRTLVSQCLIYDNVNGVVLSGTGIADNIFENNLIYKHTGYGIDIGTGVLRTGVRNGHTFTKNTLGNTRDLGTDTFIETTAGGASASEIADAVWDEVVAGHATVGTAGKMLKDAKLKATIASLK
ncbi:hypothetical protein A3D80_02965 [Candidatus Roizmanbacteria bacterium RIFCSPHIGHO2_02_FULL_40_13b]|uniref:Right handed beta helix domain-containing protein n=1 Tax=Candidatus Roizmanbacteria bacterium RIFCSPHIGHO2_01_FULL_39_24 TaxID=1802032 RepID=A0A1F7GIP2_9BACT|nr:MAG: hypothetical protein A2799_02075 [Candidatus Roizmanbacteria bacterium RIFCSPHIGHO2_01_FULL_39_24]OGK27153.1 MAG: hypothetical protein A3D80_02965 [Candidatus Roizmanbacteria bacterium RIFCSPHIGHO2_02_FULL_40_13b]OGK49441.1 MAG: hypothetical protein A3A56_00100 [Candidatus Roizmanbacteria bacterium RIFCSPLOWO2_01_FULL_40_32]